MTCHHIDADEKLAISKDFILWIMIYKRKCDKIVLTIKPSKASKIYCINDEIIVIYC